MLLSQTAKKIHPGSDARRHIKIRISAEEYNGRKRRNRPILFYNAYIVVIAIIIEKCTIVKIKSRKRRSHIGDRTVNKFSVLRERSETETLRIKIIDTRR